MGTGGTARLRQKVRSIDRLLTAPLVLPRTPAAARVIAAGLAHSGDMPVWLALAAVAWFLGGDEWKTRAILTAVGLGLVEVVVIAIKMIVRRQRPPGTSGMIYRKTDPFSFPSGHAARAVLLSLLALRLGPSAAFIAIVAWGPVMVLARIAIGIHYVLDVAAGFLLGGLLTAIVLGGAAALGVRF